MLDPRRMLIFDAVLRAGSMSGAAFELSYSPAAVSQQIASLEAEAGVPLLRRMPRGVKPTAAGGVVARHARLLSDRLAAACAELETVARGEGGALRIASFPIASGTLLPDALFGLTAELPRLAVTVEDRAAPAALSGLRDGTVDLAIVAAVNDGSDLDLGGVEATELLTTALRVMLPADHRLAGEDVIPLADLLSDHWIQTGDGMYAATLGQSVPALRDPPRLTTHTTDIGATRGLVAAGLGIAMVSDLLDLEAPGRDVVVRRLTPQPSHPLLIVAPPEPFVLPAARSLRTRLIKAHHPIQLTRCPGGAHEPSRAVAKRRPTHLSEPAAITDSSASA